MPVNFTTYGERGLMLLNLGHYLIIHTNISIVTTVLKTESSRKPLKWDDLEIWLGIQLRLNCDIINNLTENYLKLKIDIIQLHFINDYHFN